MLNEIAPKSIDWIITDPPYPGEFLPVFDDLASLALHALKPGGLLLAMVGQSYLPVILEKLSAQLTYHWTIAYLTPGGQAVQIHPRKVNAAWKPVLAFSNSSYNGRWFGDVARSDMNDNDKESHQWGQSVSGMADLVGRFVSPGDIVLDPFMGAGTTGIAALLFGARFIGSDIDERSVNIAASRIGKSE
jgi:site-specific DNA-methyltransferase (adenine-specific)